MKKECCKNCINCKEFNVNARGKPEYYYCCCKPHIYMDEELFNNAIIIKPKKMGGSKLCSCYEKIYKYKPKNINEFKYPERNDQNE